MSLNYTLGASISKSAIGALLISAQRHIQTQLNTGHGSDRIQNILPGRFWRYKADLYVIISEAILPHSCRLMSRQTCLQSSLLLRDASSLRCSPERVMLTPKSSRVLYANDLQSERRAFTWSELFQAIDLVRYCGFDRGVYLEMFTDVYIRYTWIGSIRVKLSRGPSLGGQMKTDLIKENNHSLASNEN